MWFTIERGLYHMARTHTVEPVAAPRLEIRLTYSNEFISNS